jgi:ATP-dependent exoDNAse (exonuclease V) beta subunit
MQDILRHLDANGGKTEVLQTSWRSRPELVNYVNEIFVPAFADTLSAERVRLQPRPACKSTGFNAVEYWRMQGSNLTKRSLALAKGLRDFIAGDYRLVDKNTEQIRTATYGDVAVLCRTHDNLEKVAQSLMAFDIPFSRSQGGLLQTPEAALVLAAMRILFDPQDTLATAEIICLTQGNAPEVWLQSRLEYVAKRGEKSVMEQDRQWGYDVSPLQNLLQQRPRIQYLTPVEVMEQAIHSADIRRVILTWCNDIELGKQRLLNVDKLLRFAEDYQEQCSNEGNVATVTGLLLWLEQLAKNKEDNQAANTDRNAVQLLTHHGAKGLEWPIVIAMDLDSNIKKNLWGLSVRDDCDELDITQPLTGRRLQYWLWPFGKQSKGIELNDRIEQSPYGLAAQERAIGEAKRLLYVSLTRPRDCLIVPLKDKKGEWFECLNADWMLPDEEGTNKIILPTSRQEIPATCKVITQDEAPELTFGQNALLHWFPVCNGGTTKLPAQFLPSKAPALNQDKVAEIIVLGDRISLRGTPDMAHLGEAIHALIGTQLINNPDNPRVLAECVLDSYEVSEHISIEDALICVSRLKDFVEQRLKPTNIYVEYPIEYQLSNGQSASGWIDLLIETDEGYIIVDHKSNPQSRNEWEMVALKYSGQLGFYKEAVEALTSQPVLECWVHFAVTGGVVRLF